MTCCPVSENFHVAVVAAAVVAVVGYDNRDLAADQTVTAFGRAVAVDDRKEPLSDRTEDAADRSSAAAD